MQIRKLREKKQHKLNNNRHFSEEYKQLAMQYVKDAYTFGLSKEEMARHLNICLDSLDRWANPEIESIHLLVKRVQRIRDVQNTAVHNYQLKNMVLRYLAETKVSGLPLLRGRVAKALRIDFAILDNWWQEAENILKCKEILFQKIQEMQRMKRVLGGTVMSGRGRVFTDSYKTLVAQYGELSSRAGATYSEIGYSVGLSSGTIGKWMLRFSESKASMSFNHADKNFRISKDCFMATANMPDAGLNAVSLNAKDDPVKGEGQGYSQSDQRTSGSDVLELPQRLEDDENIGDDQTNVETKSEMLTVYKPKEESGSKYTNPTPRVSRPFSSKAVYTQPSSHSKQTHLSRPTTPSKYHKDLQKADVLEPTGDKPQSQQCALEYSIGSVVDAMQLLQAGMNHRGDGDLTSDQKFRLYLVYKIAGETKTFLESELEQQLNHSQNQHQR